MLIEFSIQNHRSYAARQTFSMVASNTQAQRRGEEYASATGNNAVPYVLREACLFGANGSGKTALIDGVKFMGEFVENSFKDTHSTKSRTPFLYHSQWRDAPSEFEVVFLHGESLFQYGFALDSDRIHEEWLFERPNDTGRLRQIFTREYDAKTESYSWEISPTHLKGERESWKAQTRDDALFLSTAVHLNAEGLERPFDWLTRGMREIQEIENLSPFTASRIAEDDDWKARVLDFLQGADLFFADIEVQEINFFDQKQFRQMPEDAQAQLKSLVPDDAKTLAIRSLRKDDAQNNVGLDWHEESSGTQILFALAGPILDVLHNGLTLFVDELNTRLHPLAFRYITQLFCNPETNPHNAQLVFTTHDVTVADQDCISKEQIWLVEKGDDLASILKPFSDFKTRDTGIFRRGYLQGRYGAVPRLAG